STGSALARTGRRGAPSLARPLRHPAAARTAESTTALWRKEGMDANDNFSRIAAWPGCGHEERASDSERHAPEEQEAHLVLRADAVRVRNDAGAGGQRRPPRPGDAQPAPATAPARPRAAEPAGRATPG